MSRLRGRATGGGDAGSGRVRLTGWGRTCPTAARLVQPRTLSELEAALHLDEGRGVLPRGLGRAYGDAAQNAGGIVIDLTGLDGPVHIDSSGTARLTGGTSLDRIMRAGLAEGWFVPVTPGTRQVTVGGAVAADIHGKNHHIDGSFATHVSRLTLLTPKGVFELTPGDDLFWATAGGMGLTGVVVEAEVRMLRVQTSRMLVDTERTTDLEHTLALMAEGDSGYRYSVCWIDCLSRGRHLGRSVLTRGDHAPLDALPAAERSEALSFQPRPALPAPPLAPSGLLNATSIRVFNEMWYRRSPSRRQGEVQTLAQFFHPLDGIAGWNRLYGRRGFLQYQILVPFGREDVLTSVINQLAEEQCPSFLGVLKRFGQGDPGHLSFPAPGWTLALDMPVGPAGIGDLLDRLDRLVAEAGGRVYLAKDSRLRPDMVPLMYPRLAKWRRIRAEADPAGLMVSDLARRLDLVGER